MSNFFPKISIVIPVYNGSNFLREAINSALEQTYKNCEIIIVNDGSTDDTEEIALSHGNKIRYYSQKNGGVASALNLGIAKMKGEYFSWLSHDDIYYPDKIERQVSELAKQEDKKTIIFSGITILDLINGAEKDVLYSMSITKSVKCFLALDTDSGLNGCTLLIAKDLFYKIKKFDESLSCTQDYDLWFTFAQKGVLFKGIPESLVYSRLHAAQGCRTLPDVTKQADCLHGDFISKLTPKEMDEYEHLDYYKRTYLIYKNAGYLRTAARLLVYIYLRERKVSESAAYIFLDKEIIQLEEFNKHNQMLFSPCVCATTKKVKPRLLFYSNVWMKGGIERVLSNLFTYLSDDYEIILVSNYLENEVGFSLPENILHIKISDKLDKVLPYSLLSHCLLLQIDIFIGNPNILLDFLPIYELLNGTSVKSIACNHGNYFLPYNIERLFPLITNRHHFLKQADVSAWLTRFNTLIYGTTCSNSFWLPNPNTFISCDTDFNVKKEKNILCVGRFYDSVKRIDRVLRVFKLVHSSIPDAKLKLLGGYELDCVIVDKKNNLSLRNLLNELNIDKRSIEFLGEKEDVRQYYKEAQVHVVGSESEGFSMVINEAACYGVPTVYFKIPGLEELIEDGVNGYCVEQDDLQGMAEKIIYLLQNDAERQTLSENAKKFADRYTLQKIGERWKKLFTVLLQNKKAEIEPFLRKEYDSYSINNMRSSEYVKQIIQAFEHASNKAFSLIDEKKYSELKFVDLQKKYDDIAILHTNLLNSKAVHLSNKIKKIIGKPIMN